MEKVNPITKILKQQLQMLQTSIYMPLTPLSTQNTIITSLRIISIIIHLSLHAVLLQ
jgi:hypothetical protein